MVVSSNATATRSASTRRMFTPRAERGGDDRIGAARRPYRHCVEIRGVLDGGAIGRSRPRSRTWRQARGHVTRCDAGRRGRGTRRTSRRRPRAAPARCRCCSWPSRDGCAARASAARDGTRCVPRRPSTPRRGGRGASARIRVRVAMNPACGPPKPSGTPNRCAEPTTMSAPCSPGGTDEAAGEEIGGDDHEAARLVHHVR